MHLQKSEFALISSSLQMLYHRLCDLALSGQTYGSVVPPNGSFCLSVVIAKSAAKSILLRGRSTHLVRDSCATHLVGYVCCLEILSSLVKLVVVPTQVLVEFASFVWFWRVAHTV
jgi:hypothetical protein